MIRWKALLLASAWLAQGCSYAVRATGRIESQGDLVAITASNEKSRPLVLDADSAPLRHADGLLVELEGTLRREAIEVDAWRVVEGPHGLSAWVGEVVRTSDGGIALVVRDQGGTWQLDGPAAEALEEQIGRTVLVEGLIHGSLAIQALHWQPLEPA